MLAINTAFMTANLALKTKDERVATQTLDAKCKHSENVLKKIDEMCEKLNVDVTEVGTVAVVVGPGSFTGLRIGVSISKALGCANRKLKFIALSSLELMAYIYAKTHKTDDEFVCALNALSDLYFVAKFDKDGKKLEDEKMIEKKEFEAIKDTKVALVGDIKESLADEFINIESIDLLKFAETKEKDGEFVSLEDLLPVYLRPSQAEANLNSKIS